MVHRFAPATVVPATPMDHGCGSGGGSRVSDGERGAVVVAADMIPLVFVLRVVVPGCVVVVAGVEDARPRRWPGRRRCSIAFQGRGPWGPAGRARRGCLSGGPFPVPDRDLRGDRKSVV